MATLSGLMERCTFCVRLSYLAESCAHFSKSWSSFKWQIFQVQMGDMYVAILEIIPYVKFKFQGLKLEPKGSI